MAGLTKVVAGGVADNAVTADSYADNSITGDHLNHSTALPNGVTATTQSSGDNSTKVATTAYADAAGTNLDAAVTINESGNAVDFRVESDGNANALLVDGTNNRVGVGCAPGHPFEVRAGANTHVVCVSNTNGNDVIRLTSQASSGDAEIIGFENSASGTHAEKFKINSSGQTHFSGGNVGIGTTDPDSLLELNAAAGTKAGISLGAAGDSITASRYIGICNSTDQTDLSTNSGFSGIEFGGPSSTDEGYLAFHTHDSGVASGERMRITKNGDTFFTKTSNVFNSPGFRIAASGLIEATVNAAGCLNLNRTSDDGGMVGFYQDGIAEGNIDVNGSSISYNGAHLSRWSQLAGGAERIEILRGSVLSNLDEMCEWGEEDNEQLNRMKVSDVEGDRNVSGVFQSWDNDYDVYTNDFYCAMTGDFVIRIAQGTTVARGDLLMSAGDGTAKPQDDDIVRSKTIAKVTSTTVSTTYDDGSYCVPCVLMAC
jgi:hypothetical protein